MKMQMKAPARTIGKMVPVISIAIGISGCSKPDMPGYVQAALRQCGLSTAQVATDRFDKSSVTYDRMPPAAQACLIEQGRKHGITVRFTQ